MNQRGRKSAAKMAVVSQITDYRPAPPDVLNDAESQRWREIVNTKPTDWWDAGSIPLLTEYCRLKSSIDLLNEQLARAEKQMAETGEMPPGYKDTTGILDKKQGRMTQLAMKMRMTQQARYESRTAHTEAKKAGSASGTKLWERG